MWPAQVKAAMAAPCLAYGTFTHTHIHTCPYLKQRVDLPARLYVVTHLWHMIKCGTCEAWHMIKCGTCGRVAMVVVVVVMAGLVMVVALLLLVVVKLTVVG
eukprot:357916-Chlamydomonas_euryale.AAC.3